MEIIQVKNPAAFTIPEVATLLETALMKTQRIEPGKIAEYAPDIISMIESDNGFVFLGEEDGHFKFIALGFMPTMKLFPHATIVSFYSEGSRALRDAGKKKLLDYIWGQGYNAWAVNATGNTDAAWLKVFAQDNLDINKIGTVFEMQPT